LRNEKGAIWGLAVKIFPYPNGFNAIRVALAIFFQIPEDELEEEADENDSQEGLDEEFEDFGDEL